jgi:hypothetical protein
LDEVTHGSEQVTGPEERVVSVAQGVKDLNGLVSPSGCFKRRALNVYTLSAAGRKGFEPPMMLTAEYFQFSASVQQQRPSALSRNRKNNGYHHEGPSAVKPQPKKEASFH